MLSDLVVRAVGQSRAADSEARPRKMAIQLRKILRHDWHTTRFLTFGAFITVLAGAVTTAYFINTPTPFLPFHDSLEYVASAQRILAGGAWADPQRMPGYPLFLAILFAVRGHVTYKSAEIAQLALFVLTAVEIYVVSYRVWRNSALAAIIAAAVGMNVYFLEYVKPILSDGLALWLVTSLALAVIAFLNQPGALRLWMVAVCALALLMTRAEWYLVPVPLFAYLLFIAHRENRLQRLLPHAALALMLLYGAVAGYVYQNAQVNHYAGLTSDENINLYGKITQYGMQNEAPPRFAAIARVTDYYVAQRHIKDPWVIFWSDPKLGVNNFSLMGSYARAIIYRHPVQFLVDSVPVAFGSLGQYAPFAHTNPAGPLARPLHIDMRLAVVTYYSNWLFPVCAAFWGIALVLSGKKWRVKRKQTEFISAVAFLATYDIVMTTLGSYNAYPRLHLGTDPLMLLVDIGSVAYVLASAWHWVVRQPEHVASAYHRAQERDEQPRSDAA